MKKEFLVMVFTSIIILSSCNGAKINDTSSYQKSSIISSGITSSSSEIKQSGNSSSIISESNNSITVDTLSKSISKSSVSSSKASSSSSQENIKLDAIKIDTYLNPSTPKALYQAKVLYVSGAPSFDESITLASLQGLIANKGTEQIYIRANATYDLWLSEMKNNFGVTAIEGLTTWDLIKKFQPKLSGYILCNSQFGAVSGLSGSFNIDRSVNVATSLASQLNAIIVTKSNQAKIEALGLKCLLDVTGWSENNLLDKQNYLSQFNKKLIIEQQTYFGAELRDYASMSNSIIFFSPKSEGLRPRFLELIEKGSPVFGWGDPDQGEIGFISQIAKSISGYNVAATGAFNLSTLSGFKLKSLKQKTEIVTNKDKKHTVCFKMTDGSNLTWFLANLNNRQWFGSNYRGLFKMGWGISGTMIDNCAPTMKWYYDHMSKNDGFILAAGGLGYTYPQFQEKEQLQIQVRKINDYMKRSDLNIAEIVGNRAFNDLDTWDYYTAQPEIDGLFYIDYNNYALYKGKIIWSNGKPIISTRYNLWKVSEGNYLLPGGSPENVIKLVNEASTDPTSQDSYSIIDVHAWSMGMSDVKKCVDGFDENVRVVNPQEFLKLVNENLIKNQQ